jgi:hypothetical protein
MTSKAQIIQHYNRNNKKQRNLMEAYYQTRRTHWDAITQKRDH